MQGAAITELFWKCGGCGERIIDPTKQIYCTRCKRKLIYPPELRVATETKL
jgi:DNA-directed RNA polymerase subunit RPC12/RpoP